MGQGPHLPFVNHSLLDHEKVDALPSLGQTIGRAPRWADVQQELKSGNIT